MKAIGTKCQACGQPLAAVRFGVRLRPIWLHIVDTIVRAGEDGISRRDLAGIVYGDRTVTHAAISQHIHAINNEFAAIDHRIGRVGRNYRIVRVQAPREVA